MKTQCTVEGCTRSFVDRQYMRAHAEKPHEFCSCGWVGTVQSIHAAQLMRRGMGGVHERRLQPQVRQSKPEPKVETFPFDPDWCCCPGELIEEVMLTWNLPLRKAPNGTVAPSPFGVACARMSPEDLAGLLNGTRRLTTDLAKRLEVGTAIPVAFWLRFEGIYRAGLKAKKIHGPHRTVYVP